MVTLKSNQLILLIMAIVSLVILSCGDDDKENSKNPSPERIEQQHRELCQKFGLNYDDFSNQWFEMSDENDHWFGNVRKTDNRLVLARYDNKLKAVTFINSDIEVQPQIRLEGESFDNDLQWVGIQLFKGDDDFIKPYIRQKGSFAFTVSCNYGINGARCWINHFLLNDGTQTGIFSIEGNESSHDQFYEIHKWYKDSWFLRNNSNSAFHLYKTNGQHLYSWDINKDYGPDDNEKKHKVMELLRQYDYLYPVSYSQTLVLNGDYTSFRKVNLEEGIEEWRTDLPFTRIQNVPDELVLEDYSTNVWTFAYNVFKYDESGASKTILQTNRFTLDINSGACVAK